MYFKYVIVFKPSMVMGPAELTTNFWLGCSQPSSSQLYRQSDPVPLLPARVFGLLNQQKLIRGQTRNSGKALLGPLLQQGGSGNKQQVPLLVRSPGGQGVVSLFLIWGEGRGVARGPARGVAQVFCPPLRWWCVQGACVQYPAFAPDALLLFQALQKWQLGFLVSLYLLSRICPNCQARSYFQSHTVFFVFFLLEERCVQVQALQHCSKGSQVLACLTLTNLVQ